MFTFSSNKRLICTLAIASIFAVSQLSFASTSSHRSKKSVIVKKVSVKQGKRNKSIVVSKSTKSHKSRKSQLKHDIVDRPSTGDAVGLKHSQDPLALASNVAFVVEQDSSKVLFEKNAEVSLPIASITKLMTSLVVVESKQDLDEMIEITTDDLDKEKGTGSRLAIGAKLSRADLLHIALMSSENRAASALGRNYPGGLSAFVAAMNAKAKQLGMNDTYYVDSSGLSSKNVASARDLVKLINAAYQHPLIREYSTDSHYVVNPKGKRLLEYGTTNKLVEQSDWNIGLQKTGYIAEAGRCLVMQAIIEGRAVVMVFLDSKGKYSRLADAGRIKKWIQTMRPQA
ncbi:D-alanyl-D-alanine endopeptidase [Undibacterium sp. FT137W]|uniref:D-alanyl-D-alanine endopeptidase n=2 Tax=Undibacterium fentianense TaxID=2828728 RepID=A0A941E4R5_9BURK|nr:D-alanyl-D-alanine endopeptidase [Undibacterium fentianense]